jgi:hypothetical protein
MKTNPTIKFAARVVARITMTALANLSYWVNDAIFWPSEDYYRPARTGNFRKDARAERKAERQFERDLTDTWVNCLIAYGFIDSGVTCLFGWHAGAAFALAGWLLITYNAVRVAREEETSLDELLEEMGLRWLAATGGVTLLFGAIAGGAWLFGIPLSGLLAPPTFLSYGIGLVLGFISVLVACGGLVDKLIDATGFDKRTDYDAVFPVLLSPKFRPEDVIPVPQLTDAREPMLAGDRADCRYR